MRGFRNLENIAFAFEPVADAAQVGIFFAAKCKAGERHYGFFTQFEEMVALLMVDRQKLRRRLVKYNG
ncbi:hypothetical protein D3C75_985490 [compost metagenome]